jgi:hypothetical protein
LDRQPTTSDAATTSAIESQSKQNIPRLKSHPSFLDQPYERPSGNTPRRELKGSVSMSALKPEKSDSIKRGVREVKTDEITGETSRLRPSFSFRKLRTSTSAIFKKNEGSAEKEKEKEKIDPNVIRLDPERDKYGLTALSSEMGQSAVDTVRNKGGEEKIQQIKDDIRKEKIQDMVDDAIRAAETELFPLKYRTGMDIVKQSFRLPKTKKEDKTRKAELEAQLARSPEEWRAVVTDDGRRMPEVTDNDVALYMRTSRKREDVGRRERMEDQTVVSSSKQKARPKDPYDTSDAALEAALDAQLGPGVGDSAERMGAAKAPAQDLDKTRQLRKKDDPSTS